MYAEWIREDMPRSGALRSDLMLEPYLDVLVLHYGDRGDRLTFESVNHHPEGSNARLRFADGTEWLLLDRIRAPRVTPETAGDDVIQGTPFADTIHSGAGNDRILLYSNDTYVYHAGDGNDVIHTSGGTLVLADLTQASGVQVDWMGDPLPWWSDQDQVLRLRWAGSEAVLVVNARPGVGAPRILLGDGSEVVVLERAVLGTEGGDDMYGSHRNDDLRGLAGNDALNGGDGHDRLAGGPGIDRIAAGSGDDRIVYQRGDGVDSLDVGDLTTALDTLVLGEGIGEQDLRPRRYGEHLYLSLSDGSGGLWVLRHFAAAEGTGEAARDHALDRIVFASGAVWDAAAIQALIDRAANNQAPRSAGQQVSLNVEAAAPVPAPAPSLTGRSPAVDAVFGLDPMAAWYGGSPAAAKPLAASDIELTAARQTELLIQAMAGMAPPAMGQTTLATGLPLALVPLTAPAWF